MNFTAELPNGMTKDKWIALLKPGTVFCTRRTMKCANCGENSLKHDKGGYCQVKKTRIDRKVMDFFTGGQKPSGKTYTHVFAAATWQPLPPTYKVGKRYAICSGRGTGAICVCGRKKADHKKYGILCMNDHSKDFKARVYRPLSRELVAIDDDLEWTKRAFKGKSQTERYEIMCAEAKKEGFQSWQQWEDWMAAHYGGIPKCWRYQFKR